MIMSQVLFDLFKEGEGQEERTLAKLVVLVAKNTIDETYYWIGKRKISAAKTMGAKMTKVLEKNHKYQKTGLDAFI